MRQYRGVKFRKVKANDSYRRVLSRYTGEYYTATTIGRVHVVARSTDGEILALCGRTRNDNLFSAGGWEPVPDSTNVTCLNCLKFPDIVARFDPDVKARRDMEQAEIDSYPDIEDFQ